MSQGSRKDAFERSSVLGAVPPKYVNPSSSATRWYWRALKRLRNKTHTISAETNRPVAHTLVPCKITGSPLMALAAKLLSSRLSAKLAAAEHRLPAQIRSFHHASQSVS